VDNIYCCLLFNVLFKSIITVYLSIFINIMDIMRSYVIFGSCSFDCSRGFMIFTYLSTPISEGALLLVPFARMGLIFIANSPEITGRGILIGKHSSPALPHIQTLDFCLSFVFRYATLIYLYKINKEFIYEYIFFPFILCLFRALSLLFSLLSPPPNFDSFLFLSLPLCFSFYLPPQKIGLAFFTKPSSLSLFIRQIS
jgi:hypothetical protein